MTCPYSREDLSAYIDAEVDETAHARIREHLRACPKCKREVAWLRTVAQMVGGLPRVEPDTALTWSAERQAAEPGQTMRCPVVLPEASAFLDGELPAGDAQAVLAHLAACDPCYHAFKDLERISEAMVATGPSAVPTGLEGRIMAAVQAERRFSLRRLLSRTCEACAPTARVSFRLAAAAVFVLAVLLAVWHTVGPQGPMPVVAVTGPTVASAPAPAPDVGPIVATAPVPTERPQAPVRRPGPAVLVATPRPPTVPPTGPRPAPGSPAPPLPSGGTAHAPVGPTPGVPSVPVPAVPDRTPPPQPDASPLRSMMASLPPRHPSPPTEPATPATSKPSAVLAKSTPPGHDAVAPPPIRVAELPPAGDAETDADIHVHVSRTSPGATVPAVPGGLDTTRLRAAEARLKATMRDAARAQPRRFPISR
jgi:anti-sigma factor RsiW